MKIIDYIKRKLSKKKNPKAHNKEPLNYHSLYEDGSYVPDDIYNGHYDCGDKD